VRYQCREPPTQPPVGHDDHNETSIIVPRRRLYIADRALPTCIRGLSLILVGTTGRTIVAVDELDRAGASAERSMKLVGDLRTRGWSQFGCSRFGSLSSRRAWMRGDSPRGGARGHHRARWPSLSAASDCKQQAHSHQIGGLRAAIRHRAVLDRAGGLRKPHAQRPCARRVGGG